MTDQRLISSIADDDGLNSRTTCVEWSSGIALALGSVTRRSAEERVAEDWAAVGTAIKQRRAELGFTQIGLAEQASVSKQVVYELEKAIVRRRGRRTLVALSEALGWHEGHLAAVLAGHLPPRIGEPVPKSDDDVPGHISVVEHYLRQLLDEVQTVNTRLDDLTTKVEAVNERTRSDDEQMGR